MHNRISNNESNKRGIIKIDGCWLSLHEKKQPNGLLFVKWELTDSNRRPSACKADALNQLS